MPALDMPPYQTRPKETHHELLAYPPDLRPPKVEGSVVVSQDLATKYVRERRKFSIPALRRDRIAEVSLSHSDTRSPSPSHPACGKFCGLLAVAYLAPVRCTPVPRSSLSMSTTRQP